MSEEPLWSIFVNASLINNFVLAYFLGGSRRRPAWAGRCSS
jgi:hypothetical protein